MSFFRLPFPSLDWSPGGHPLEKKKLVPDRSVALLEFAPGFKDPNWCARGHVIYVIDGTLDLELHDRHERLRTGEACVLDPQTRHRASNPADVPVRLFVHSTES